MQDRNDRDREIAKENQNKLIQEKEILQDLAKKITSDIQQMARRVEIEK